MAVYGIVLLSVLGAALLALLGVGVTCAVFANGFELDTGTGSNIWSDNTPDEPACYSVIWGGSGCDDVEDEWSDDVDGGWDGVHDGQDGWDYVDSADSTDGQVELITCSIVPDSLDFGLVAVGESVTRELTLSCTGLVDVAPLEFLPWHEYPDSVVDVSTVVVGDVSEVSGTSEATVAVTWTPSAPVVADPFGELRVRFSGENYNYFGDQPDFEVVTLRGRTPAPELVLSDSSPDLGGARPGESVTQTLVVANEGDAALHLSGIAIDVAGPGEADASWSLSWGPVDVLEPGESTNVAVTFIHPEPGQPVGHSGRDIVIVSDDPRGHSRAVPVVAYYWSQERCVVAVDGPVVFPAATIPSRELVDVAMTLRNDGDGPCDAVQMALRAGAAAHDTAALPAPCDESGAMAFEVVLDAPSTSLAPGESTTLSTTYRAPNVAGSVSVPVGVIGLARDPGMPMWGQTTEVQASALVNGLCPSSVGIRSDVADVVVPEGAWMLEQPPEGCTTRYVASIGGAGSVCSATLSAGCDDAVALSTPLSPPDGPACESGGIAIGAGLSLELERLGAPLLPSCALEVTFAGEPPVTWATPITVGDTVIPESFVTAKGVAVLFLRGSGAAASSGLDAYLPTFFGALPEGARVAFGNPDGGLGLYSSDDGGAVVTPSTLTSYASLATLAASWLAAPDGDATDYTRLDHALGATAWLVPDEPIAPGFGCTGDEHCPPPLVCLETPDESSRPCGGPSAQLANGPGTTVHVVWIGNLEDAGDDPTATLDRWQHGGVLTKQHLVVHRVAGSVGDCAPPGSPSGLMEDLRLETGGTVVDACDGAAAWEWLGAAIASERGAYRLQYSAVPKSVYEPGKGLLCSSLQWSLSPSGRTVRTPLEPDCNEPPGFAFYVEYDALCVP